MKIGTRRRSSLDGRIFGLAIESTFKMGYRTGWGFTLWCGRRGVLAYFWRPEPAYRDLVAMRTSSSSSGRPE